MNDYSFKMVLENKQKDMEKKLITNKTNIIQARVSARFFGLLLITLSKLSGYKPVYLMNVNLAVCLWTKILCLVMTS